MSTWFGRALRNVSDVFVTAVTYPATTLGVNTSSLYSSSKNATAAIGASKFVSNLALDAMKGGTDKDAKPPTVTDQIGTAITSLFGGVAEKAGNAAGVSAGDTLSKQAPSWLWPIIIVGAVIIIFGLVLVSSVKRKRRR